MSFLKAVAPNTQEGALAERLRSQFAAAIAREMPMPKDQKEAVTQTTIILAAIAYLRSDTLGLLEKKWGVALEAEEQVDLSKDGH